MTRTFALLFLRQFAVTLAALALLLQAAVPSGFMLAASDSGFPVSVVICGDAGRTVSAADLGLDGQDKSPLGHEDESAPCAFAGFNAGVTAPDAPPALSAPVVYVAVERAPAPSRAVIGAGANAPPPSRAPPSVV